MKILNVEQMTEVDRLSTEKCGIPSLLLMENAGMNLFRALRQTFREHLSAQRILILCGKGNNGGDGLVLARQLVQRGMEPRVVLLGRRQEVKGDAAANLNIFLESGQPVQEVDSLEAWRGIQPEMARADVIVDALLGTGLGKPLRDLYAEAVRSINQNRAFVLAVDIPTGMFSDSLEPSPLSVQADLTVTFTAPKIAHVFNPDQAAMGRVIVAPIGSPEWLMDRPEYYLQLLEPEELSELLTDRPLDTHKGALGKVAVIGGSRGKAGAAALAASAALHAGSGLVTALVPRGAQGLVASFLPDIMTEGLPETDSGGFNREAASPVLEILAHMNAAALGPGLGTHPESFDFVRELVTHSPVPLVLDADALNALAQDPSKIRNDKGQPLVLTPHPGEFGRLIGRRTSELLPDRIRLSRNFARQHGVWLVLKGFRSLIAEPGGQVYVCDRGNPGMATGGMGDVLSGVLLRHLGELDARGWNLPEEVTWPVALGVYLHSAAGDLAEEDLGPESLTASALIEYLGEAARQLRESSS